MLQFAVQVPGDAENKGHWVLMVDAPGERLLIAEDDKALRWVPLADCKFLRAHTPDMVTPVVAVPLQQQAATPKLTLPHMQINGKPTRP